MKKLLISGALIVIGAIAIDYANMPLTQEELEQKQKKQIEQQIKEIEKKCDSLLDKRRIDLTIRESEYFKQHCEGITDAIQ